MRALIITYYWPPAGGSGVQRWLKFVKYLQDFNIEPVVYIPENANYPIEDKSLLKETPKGIEILKLPIKNPQDFFSSKKKKTGVANVSKGGFLSWLRGNFFIPDAKKFWIQPSVEYLEKYINENNIDVIISTGPPHSMHLIANQLKKKTNLKWIADFRDPWTNLYYNSDFNLTTFAKKKHKELETEVLQNADVILTVSHHLKKEFEQIASNVKVITNGYDDEVLTKGDILLDTKFSIAHIGLLPKQSNPKLLWKVLQEVSEEDKNFDSDLSIILTGNVSEEVREDIRSYGLTNNTIFNSYIPHKKAVELQKKAQVLLLLIPNVKNSKGILTGKLFEYITSKRPILAIGPEDGDLAMILTKTETGAIVSFTNEAKLKSEVLQLYANYKKDRLVVEPKNIEQYHRKELTKKLSEIIKELIAN